MGYVVHNAIVATAWQEEAAQALADYARRVGAEAIVGAPQVNGYVTVCITPDGSKEGWQNSDDGDCRRAKIRAWLAQAGLHGQYFEWCEVAYGDDPGNAQVVTSAYAEEAA